MSSYSTHTVVQGEFHQTGGNKAVLGLTTESEFFKLWEEEPCSGCQISESKVETLFLP